MNLLRINDTPYFTWMLDEGQTVKLLLFLKELQALRLEYTDDGGMKFKGNYVDTEV